MKTSSPPPAALEIASALLVPAAAFGFIRVFDIASAVTPLIGASLLSTAVAVLLRRVHVPLALAAPASALFLLALMINRFAPGTAAFGLIPTEATRAEFSTLYDELVLNFQELKTPVPALDAFVASSMIGAWIMAFLTDWGALRLRLAFEPVLPGGLLFIFSAVLGAGVHQIEATVVFAVAVSFWAVTQRSVNLAESNTWLANDRRRGSLGVAQAAGLLAVIAVLVGVITGPRLPGASAQEMVSFRDAGEPTRTVVSPYVNIQARLVNQTSTQLFTVASEQPSYWRLAGLDTFEGNIWKVAGNFSPEDGKLPGQDTLGGQRDTVLQDFSIDALAAIWLPAAFAPAEIHSTSSDITWNADTGSLTVANDVPSSDGVDYTIESSVPRFTSTELRAAPDIVPADIADRYLPLPDIPSVVLTEAQRITADAPTRYDKVLALQQYFRSFTYSVDLSGKPTEYTVDQFLEERVGFCQQFAGTFALMARSLQIPARVAIGFTWGDPIGVAEDGRTIYQVTGRQTHAWPEVWFDGLGWVAFEPTPGRGAPSAAEYTQVAAAQDSLVQPDNPDRPVTTTTNPSIAGEGVPAQPQIPEVDLNEPAGTSATPSEGGGISLGAVLKFLAVVAVVGGYFGGIPAWHRFRRYSRRQQITTPADEVETAWAEVAESLELGYGLNRRPSETRHEYARRLGSDLRIPGRPMYELATKATVARYHPGGVNGADGAQATSLANEIEASVRDRVPAYHRWKRMINPRRILKPSARVTVTRPSTQSGPVAPAPSQNGSRPRQLV
jgi:transglutaminase-like putative cysteine protease